MTPSHVATSVKEGSSVIKVVTDSIELVGQTPCVAYKISYIVADVPPVIIPDVPSITAASVGKTLNIKTPPDVPEILAEPPSQFAVIVKEGSSAVKAVTVSTELTEHEPGVE